MSTLDTMNGQESTKMPAAKQPWSAPAVAVILPAEMTLVPPCGVGPGNAKGQCNPGS